MCNVGQWSIIFSYHSAKYQKGQQTHARQSSNLQWDMLQQCFVWKGEVFCKEYRAPLVPANK
eukprot:5278514-Prorocentrum_lima.AAC.1